MVNARDSYTKSTKPKKGGEVPKVSKGLIIYSEKFQDYQIFMLKLLKSQVNNG
jgi:hypothetical protein